MKVPGKLAKIFQPEGPPLRTVWSSWFGERETNESKMQTHDWRIREEMKQRLFKKVCEFYEAKK